MATKEKVFDIPDILIENGYQGNPNLKRVGTPINFTEEQIDEWIKCKNDIIYFCENYIKIVHVDYGLIPFKLRDYQKDMIISMNENRKTTAVMCRQSGKTTTYVGFLTHYILFNSDKTVALLANKGDTAREILSRVQLAYEHLPKWLQQGISEWNKGSFLLENNSRILAGTTSSSSIRGYSISCLVIDEVAFIEGWDEFFTSVFPTISSGKTTKMIQVSTPNGLNHFYKTVSNIRDGRDKTNHLFEVVWHQVPDRDEDWYKEVIAGMNYDYEKFKQEHENEFLGSSGTLITGQVLKDMVHKIPISQHDGLSVYHQPTYTMDAQTQIKKDNCYIIICDVSQGKGLDNSAFHVIDITKTPYKQVCVYKNNMVTPVEYAQVIYRTAKTYNNAHTLIESNDIGTQVCHSLFTDYAYESVLFTKTMGRKGVVLSGYTRKGDIGVRTTKTVKAVGCSMLKMLVEGQQLIVNDFDTIHELSVFSKKGKSYEAEQGEKDDLAMGLVLFAWATDQDYFKELSNTNVMQEMREKRDDDINQMLPPDFHRHDGLNQTNIMEEDFIDSAGDHWVAVDNFNYPFTN